MYCSNFRVEKKTWKQDEKISLKTRTYLQFVFIDHEYMKLVNAHYSNAKFILLYRNKKLIGLVNIQETNTNRVRLFR